MIGNVTMDDGSALSVPGIWHKPSVTPGHHRNAPALGQDTDAVLWNWARAAQIRGSKERGIVAASAASPAIPNSTATANGAPA
jgi:formyl-CoA transferase